MYSDLIIDFYEFHKNKCNLGFFFSLLHGYAISYKKVNYKIYKSIQESKITIK